MKFMGAENKRGLIHS